MFSVVWPEAAGIHHLKYQNPPSLSDWFTGLWHTCFSFFHFLPSLPSIPAFPFRLLFPSLFPLIYFLLFVSPLQINSYFKLPYASLFFPSPHFFSHSLTPLFFPFMTLSVFLSLHISLSLLLPALSLSPSSFDGLVVGGTDSARLELLSQCEMGCCGDDMSHFTLDWWCVWEVERDGERERELECRVQGSGEFTKRYRSMQTIGHH